MTTAKQRWDALEQRRRPFLARGRDAARLTIPSLLPPEHHESQQGQQKLPTPYQSVGARGVNNLASKLLLSLMPPNDSFFLLDVDERAAQSLTQVEGAAAKAGNSLLQIQNSVNRHVEVSGMRVSLHEALKLSIVTGNALVRVEKPRVDLVDGLRVWKLDSYMCRRDHQGTVVELVIREYVDWRKLPPAARKLVDSKNPLDSSGGGDHPDGATVFTWIQLEDSGETYKAHQEVNEKIVEGTEGQWTTKKFPYIVLRFARVAGEDYGRGMIEEYMGDLMSLENLQRAIVEGSLAAAKVIWMKNPSGPTRIERVARARNGSFVQGLASDFSALRLEKNADFSVAQATADGVAERLSFAFLLNQTAVRQAERVTAEEIRFVARELEEALGGTYSILTQEFQLPLVQILLESIPDLPKLPKGIVSPRIVTGIEALGRENQLVRLQSFSTGLTALLGPEVAADWIIPEGMIDRLALGTQVDKAGLVRSSEEVQQIQEARAQAQQQAQMIDVAGKEVAKGVAQAARPA